ncbi:MAG: PhnD/SsuA/transferrin family substrate-binding protein, partial [Bradyrhizobium sp.]
EYLNRHDRVAYAVSTGQFDAGALEGTIFHKLADQGLQIRQLASFQNVTKPWVARAGLDPRIAAALRQGLLGLHDKAALAALRFDGFLPATDADYAVIRSSITENPLFFQKPTS